MVVFKKKITILLLFFYFLFTYNSFSEEKNVLEVLELIQKGDFQKVVTFVNQTKYLFRGATGVRHVDFIGYKK